MDRTIHKVNTYKVGDRQHTPWGHWLVVAVGDGYVNKHIHVNPHSALSKHVHHKRTELWVIIEGEGQVQVAGQMQKLLEKQSLSIAPGVPHRIANKSDKPLRLIEIQMGDYLCESDLLRLEDNYGRVTP